jgi:hypothetical protein
MGGVVRTVKKVVKPEKPPPPPPAPVEAPEPEKFDPAEAVDVGAADARTKAGTQRKRRQRGTRYNPVLTGAEGDTSAATVTRKGLLGE